ncbi:hypothetical protein NLJ89_g8578 [Agrocybe chaxingu]|uniref:O-methyltransferase n=1 Tax=Agrocybe chaxingu TaxID=84603 RepID=A0A9W8MQM8_9AGAR|nr:hypothetical protein NLJ89_g8578 [Agrocybe chaxingu]
MAATGRRPPHPTTIEDWARSDVYHNSFLLPKDDALEAALKNNKEQGLPDIGVSAAQGKLLNLLAKSINAKRVLEVGTLGGYSTIWFAKALPADGKIVTFEIDEGHAKIASQNLEAAGLAEKVSIVVGAAAQELPKLHPEEPFDLAFIDADKPSNLVYFQESKRLLRKGGVIIVDNVVRNGRVSDPNLTNEDIEGVRALLKAIQSDEEIEATTIGTVGEKGYDGFLYALRK